MSHRKTNIENYLYFADSEALAGSNDDNKVVMFPTSAVTALVPVGDATVTTTYRRQDGTHNSDTATIAWNGFAPTVEGFVERINILVANFQKDHKLGFVNISDGQNKVTCNQVVSTAAGAVVLTTTAL